MMTAQEISKAMMSLPFGERVGLFSLLEATISEEYKKMIENASQADMELVEARLSAHRAGRNPEVSWDDAMQEIFPS